MGEGEEGGKGRADSEGVEEGRDFGRGVVGNGGS